MQIGLYVKKPVTVRATQFDGTVTDASHIIDWVLSHDGIARWRCKHVTTICNGVEAEHELVIQTLESGEGYHIVDPGDFVIRGIQGEFYPCKPDIFEATYNGPISETEKAILANPDAVAVIEADQRGELEYTNE